MNIFENYGFETAVYSSKIYTHKIGKEMPIRWLIGKVLVYKLGGLQFKPWYLLSKFNELKRKLNYRKFELSELI